MRRSPSAMALLLPLLALILGAAATTGLRGEPAVPASLGEGLTFYLPLDGSLEALQAKGYAKAKAAGPAFEAGRVGESVRRVSAPLQFAGEANFSRPQGTMSLWVQPHAPLDQLGAKHDACFLATDHVVLKPHKDGGVIFMTGTLRDKEFKWDYGVVSPVSKFWKPGQWHHLAATWDSETGEKKLYLDGKPVAARRTEWISSVPLRGVRWVGVGKVDGEINVDEIALWDRVLNEDEVRLLAAAPEEVAGFLQSLPQREAPKAKAVAFDYHRDDADRVIVEPGQAYAATVPVRNVSEAPFEGKLEFVLKDFWLREHGRSEQDLRLKPGEEKKLRVSFAAPAKGPFKITARVFTADGTLEEEKDVACFAGWPKPKGPPAADSFFGHHLNAGGTQMLDQAARLGMVWNRNHNMLQTTWWPRVEPEEGQIKGLRDEDLRKHKPRHLRVLGQFFGTPYWAAESGPLPPQGPNSYPYSNVPRMDEFRRYVFETVSRYKDDIKHWEVWNEPDVSMFWKGTPEQYAELCRTAYEAAKEADPECLVFVGGLGASHWKWHEEAAKAGAFKYLDGISFHFGLPNSAPEKMYDGLGGVVAHFRKLAREAGHPDNIPLWSTEGGNDASTWLEGMDFEGMAPPAERMPLNWRTAAIRAVQGSAIHQLHGVGKHFYYLHNYGWSGPGAYYNTNALELTNGPKPMLMARVAMAAQTDGTRCVEAVRREEGRFWAVLFEKPDGQGTVALCWAGDEGEVACPGDFSAFSAVDLMGNAREIETPLKVTEEPVYLHTTLAPEAVKAKFAQARLDVLREPAPLPASPGSSQPDIPQLPDYVAVKEGPGRERLVDLRPYANMGLADEVVGDGKGGWSDEGPLNDARELPVGRQEFYAVPFMILDPAANEGKSVITLQGSAATRDFPAAVRDIPLGGEKVRNLYFLHALSWGVKGPAAAYRIRYADGSIEEIVVSAPENTNNWWKGHHEDEVSRPVPFRVTNTMTGKPAWRYLRVLEWENPKPDVPVESMDFVSAGSSQTPILLAVTVLK